LHAPPPPGQTWPPLNVHVDVASHVIEHGAPPVDVTSHVELLVQLMLYVPPVSAWPAVTLHTEVSHETSRLKFVEK
jgi:hypothetical protein